MLYTPTPGGDASDRKTPACEPPILLASGETPGMLPCHPTSSLTWLNPCLQVSP